MSTLGHWGVKSHVGPCDNYVTASPLRVVNICRKCVVETEYIILTPWFPGPLIFWDCRPCDFPLPLTPASSLPSSSPACLCFKVHVKNRVPPLG